MADEPDPDGSPPSPPPSKSGRKQPGGAPSPHDALFRRIFGVPANAASQLGAVLPPDLADRLDLSRLAPVPGSFVDEALRWRHSDVLFTAPLDGHDAFVYVLIEHQSSDDPLMAFRMLRYITRIWDQYAREHPGTRRLPAVIPLVVYQGPDRWTSPVQLLDVIDLDPDGQQAVQAYLPRFGFLLDDLSRISEDQLLNRKVTPIARVTLLALKTAPGNPQITALLWRWEDQLRAVLDQPGGGEAFLAILTYIQHVSETPGGELHDLAASLGPDAEEAYVTTAEMLRAEGEARGEARGKARGKAEDILVVFEQRGIDVDGKSRERIESCTDLDALNGWFRRAFKVDQASDLFEE
jgi:predicted transposase/invertase (TIGR01784 family)